MTPPALPDGTYSGGLSGLRERVRAADGELHVDSAPGAGTVIEARLPLGG